MRTLLFLLLAMPLIAADGPGPCPPAWGYEAIDGPDRWGQMGWPRCDTGYVQSPIDLGGAADASLPAVKIDYEEKFAVTIQNTGHEIKVWPLAANTVTYEGTTYTLQQFHFHVQAEHTIGPRRAAAELHFVHESEDRKALAIGVFIVPGTANDALTVLLRDTPRDECTSKKLPEFSAISTLLPPENVRKSYYRYGGSLTTPACDEGVTFVIFSTPITATREQIDALKVSGHENARPVQPLAGRAVQKTGM